MTLKAYSEEEKTVIERIKIETFTNNMQVNSAFQLKIIKHILTNTCFKMREFLTRRYAGSQVMAYAIATEVIPEYCYSSCKQISPQQCQGNSP